MLDLKSPHLALLLALLERHVPEAEVWAYGSRVNGQSHQGSDLDLVVRNPADLGAACANLWPLRDALTESDLPFLVDVFDWAQIPEHFRRRIEQEHVVVRSREGAGKGVRDGSGG